MDQKLKNYLGWLSMLVILVLAYSAFSFAHSYSKMIQPGSYRTFNVSGQGRVTAKNDIAQFSYSVIIQGGKDITQIKKQSDELTGKIQTVLKDQAVDPKDVETVSYNLEPRYQYFNCNDTSGTVPCRPSEIIGYTLTQTDSVKIRDLTKVDKIVSGVVASGANNVSQLNFTVDDPTSLQTAAKAEAIKQAIEQAKILAKAGGFRVGRIISIDELNIPMYDSFSAQSNGVALMKAPEVRTSVANFNPGSNEVNSSVNVRFEIE